MTGDWNLMARHRRDVRTISRPSSHSCRRYCFGFMPRGMAMQLLPALQDLLVMPRHVLGVAGELLALLLHHLVGEHGVGDLDDVARGERVLQHFLAHADDLLDHQRRAEDAI